MKPVKSLLLASCATALDMQFLEAHKNSMPFYDASEEGVDAFVIDQNATDIERQISVMIPLLWPELPEDPDFIENEQAITQEDEELCTLGFDPSFPADIIECFHSRSGQKLAKTKFFTPARKFKHLKLIILWLQKQQEFGRYCYYGCHCLPEGRHELGAKNWGVPVDPIDRTCKNFYHCYECAKMRDQECSGDRVKYKYKLKIDKTTGEKDIACLNPEGSCPRNICECDKRWSKQLSAVQDEFDPKYHKTRSIKEIGKENMWDVNEQCLHAGSNKYGKALECCGDTFPDVMPLQQGKQCCGSKTYDPNMGRECCPGDKIRPSCPAV